MSDDTSDSTEPVSDGTTTADSVGGADDTEAPADATEGEADDQDTEDSDADVGDRHSREAAKYRRRLRAVEAERDQLTQRLEAMQRSECERQAVAVGLRPAALWTAATLSDLLADDGTIDTDKVTAAIEAARDLLGVPQPKHHVVPREGRAVTSTPTRSTIGDMVDAVMGRSD